MAGGTWDNQDKIRPGAYINFKSKKKDEVTANERGVVTMPLILPWGQECKVIEVTKENIKSVLGLELDEVILVREALKKANKVLIYRINTGEKAKVALGPISITAAYSGEKGNSITVVIQNNIDVTGKFDVITLCGMQQVDKQTIAKIGDFKNNGYIELASTGDIQVTAGIKLVGGTNGSTTNSEYAKYLSDIELYDFNVMAVPTNDTDLKSTVTNFIKRLREQEGKKVQAVLENYSTSDYEGIISVKNGVLLQDREIKPSEAIAFVAGATAGARSNQSNTYISYPGAIDLIKRYTSTEIIEILKNGEIVFTLNNGKIVIEQDINTLKTYTDDKNVDYRKNRVIRVLDGTGNDIKGLWDNNFIGKVDNNSDGRNLFKKEVIKLMESKQKQGAIENFVAEDVIVEKGGNKDAVLVKISVKPIDAMEKLYMEVEVQ